MLTRAAASKRDARPPPPESSLSSTSPPPDPGPPVIPAAAAASGSSDEYFSPPTSPPVRRQGRLRPSTGLGSGDQQVPSRVPATGGCAQRMKWTQKMNENVMRSYYGSTEGGTNLTAYRDRMLSLFRVTKGGYTSLPHARDEGRARASTSVGLRKNLDSRGPAPTCKKNTGGF
ncbi:hypothetical protein B5X24_HaOG212865 [Helicoverpa armigera]|uniref:Uncharacterized protein n=1 Tax=Helicoverpa armigera TaxID=29058 RepID=A0A2W1B6A9_HELAM|nr:hypothetical protein B5X24_HaOG212865 [Helicoverpa armigera]